MTRRRVAGRNAGTGVPDAEPAITSSCPVGRGGDRGLREHAPVRLGSDLWSPSQGRRRDHRSASPPYPQPDLLGEPTATPGWSGGRAAAPVRPRHHLHTIRETITPVSFRLRRRRIANASTGSCPAPSSRMTPTPSRPPLQERYRQHRASCSSSSTAGRPADHNASDRTSALCHPS